MELCTLRKKHGATRPLQTPYSAASRAQSLAERGPDRQALHQQLFGPGGMFQQHTNGRRVRRRRRQPKLSTPPLILLARQQAAAAAAAANGGVAKEGGEGEGAAVGEAVLAAAGGGALDGDNGEDGEDEEAVGDEGEEGGALADSTKQQQQQTQELLGEMQTQQQRLSESAPGAAATSQSGAADDAATSTEGDAESQAAAGAGFAQAPQGVSMMAESQQDRQRRNAKSMAVIDNLVKASQSHRSTSARRPKLAPKSAAAAAPLDKGLCAVVISQGGSKPVSQTSPFRTTRPLIQTAPQLRSGKGRQLSPATSLRPLPTKKRTK